MNYTYVLLHEPMADKYYIVKVEAQDTAIVSTIVGKFDDKATAKTYHDELLSLLGELRMLRGK